MDPATKSALLANVETLFLEFLTTYREPSPEGGYEKDFYYIEQAKAMVREGKKTLYVKMSSLEKVDTSAVSFEPSDLRQVIETKYFLVRKGLNNAVGKLIALLNDPDLKDLATKLLDQHSLSFAVAFYDLELYCGVRDLRTDKLGRMMTICGTVTRTTEVKPELLEGTYQCNECNREITGVEQQFKVTPPARCLTKNCGNRTNWTLRPDSRTTRWGDWQRIRLQENESEVPAGSMPRTMDVIVRDEITERCKPGDKVLITGCLVVVPDVPTMMNPSELKMQVRRSLNTRSDASFGADGVRGLSGTGNRDLTYKMAFYGIFIDEDSDWSSRGKSSGGENVRSTEKMYLSQNDKDRFQAMSEHVGVGGKRDCFDVLARAIAPSIHGHLSVKKGILLMLIGGVPKKTDEGIKLRGDLNMCLLGDPATAKSALLKWTSNFLPRAVYASGKCSTAAGLTASVVKDADLDNEKIIEPGALMLADNGICCIDEFELMEEKDRVAIHEAMEQQTITLSKAGIQATLNARTSILAACLPKNTYYQPTQPLHKNVDMAPPIMSRFDLFFVLQDLADDSQDRCVAEHIINMHRRVRDEETTEVMSQVDLQRYIRLARSLRPKVTPEAQQRLIRCYKKLREDRAFVQGAAGVTVRQLESLIRLSEAVARVYLEDLVLVEHVNEAFELQNNASKRADKSNVDLSMDMPEEEVPEPTDGQQPPPARDAMSGRTSRVQVSFPEYQRVSHMVTKYLADREEMGEEVKEGDLIAWYMEQVEGDLQTEAQFLDESHKVRLIIKRLVDKDRVIIVWRLSDDPSRPEDRVLLKHPNYPVGELVATAK